MKEINTLFEWNCNIEFITVEVNKNNWMTCNPNIDFSDIKEATNSCHNHNDQCDCMNKRKNSITPII